MWQVVQMARSMGALSVRGNWDEAFLASVDGRSASQVCARQAWACCLVQLPPLKLTQAVLQPGAKAQAAVTFDPELTAEDQAYLRALPFSLSIPSHGVLVVHAGLVPGVSLKAQQLEDLIEVCLCLSLLHASRCRQAYHTCQHIRLVVQSKQLVAPACG